MICVEDQNKASISITIERMKENALERRQYHNTLKDLSFFGAYYSADDITMAILYLF